MTQEFLAKLWKKGVRKIEINYSGGEDSGGIDDVDIFPTTSGVEGEDIDEIKSIGDGFFSEFGIGFTGDGHYSGSYGTITIDIEDEQGNNSVNCPNNAEYHNECDCSSEDLQEGDGSCDTDHGMNVVQEDNTTEIL